MTEDPNSSNDAALAAVEQLFNDEPTPQAIQLAGDALATAIRAQPSAQDLEQLLDSWPIDELFGMGAADLELWSQVAHALVDLATTTTPPADAARILGWARAGCSASPTDIVRPDLDARLQRSRKARFADSFAQRIPVFRQFVKSEAAELRAAGAHALCWCASITREDFSFVESAARSEPEPSALASQLLALGVLARRLETEPERERAKKFASSNVNHAEPFVAAMAATALALVGETLTTPAVRALVSQLSEPTALPDGWGFWPVSRVRWQSDTIACSVLCWAHCQDSALAVPALAAIPSKPAMGLDVTTALVHTAFTERDVRVSPLGLVAAELDATETQAISALISAGPQPALARIALPTTGASDSLVHFLDGANLDWRPIPVEVSGTLRHFHFGRLWGEVITGNLAIESARDALFRACDAREAVSLVTHFGVSRLPAFALATTAESWQRDQDFALSVIAEATRRGFDWQQMIADVSADARAGLPAIATVAYLRAHPGEAPAEHHGFFAKGIENARCVEPLRSLIAALPTGIRRALLGAVTPGIYSVHVLDLLAEDS